MTKEDLKALLQSAFFVHTKESNDNGEYQCLECGATKDYGGEHYHPAGKDAGPTSAICPDCYSEHPDEAEPADDGWVYGVDNGDGEVMRWKAEWPIKTYAFAYPTDTVWRDADNGEARRRCEQEVKACHVCTEAKARRFRADHDGTWPEEPEPTPEPDMSRCILHGGSRIGPPCVECDKPEPAPASGDECIIPQPPIRKDRTMKKHTLTLTIPAFLYRWPAKAIAGTAKGLWFYAKHPAKVALVVAWHAATLSAAATALGYPQPIHWLKQGLAALAAAVLS